MHYAYKSLKIRLEDDLEKMDGKGSISPSHG